MAMKISQNNLDDNTMEVQTGPKLRNIHDEAEVPEEKPEGADVRLRIGVIVIAALILFVGIKGSITKSRLESDYEAAQRLYTETEAEALLYGITQDDDGDLVVPDTEPISVDISELEWTDIDTRNDALLQEFASLLLNWEGTTQYEKVRQTLITDWGFNEKNSRLLTSFMPALDEDLDASIALQGKPTIYPLEETSKSRSYFMICTVRTTTNVSKPTYESKPAGLVGIQITIANEDAKVSNVAAQTLQ